jgi:hypothetical protein
MIRHREQPGRSMIAGSSGANTTGTARDHDPCPECLNMRLGYEGAWRACCGVAGMRRPCYHSRRVLAPLPWCRPRPAPGEWS